MRSASVGLRLGPRARRNRPGRRRRPAGGGPPRPAARGSRGARDLDAEAEAVEQLRAQLALLRVHGADQHEARGVPDRDAVALDGGAAHRGGVQQQVDEVVVQQVDLVDVQQPAVRLGEQARVELGDALGQRAAEVQRADDPVLGGADRQLHQAGRPGGGHRGGEGAGRRGRPGRARPGRRRTGSPRRRSPSGSSAARARTIVDFAVPFSPRTSTPPTSGETAVRARASARSSAPTTALNGKCCCT